MHWSQLAWVVGLVALPLYWRLPRHRDAILAIGSLVGIAVLDWRSAVAAPILAFSAYEVGRRAPQLAKWKVAAYVVAILAFLVYFKYLPTFFAPKAPEVGLRGMARVVTTSALLIPLGTSYVTFRLIHYVVDARRGLLPPHDRVTFLGYAFFLPMFPAGPIQRFDDYVNNRTQHLTRAHVAEAGCRIVYGLVKKFVLVDVVLARTTSARDGTFIGALPLVSPPLDLWDLLRDGGALPAWQFVIHHFTTWYLDLSAYSDIAIGVALLFGIRLMENFDWPLLAPNPTAFWKRYHVSLSSWCQRYVYLPVMGRTRSPYASVYATMLIMGLWHGGTLNYVAWGAYHATILSLYLTWGRIKRWRKWKLKHRAWDVPSTILTALALSASAVWGSTADLGIGTGFKLLGQLVGIRT